MTHGKRFRRNIALCLIASMTMGQAAPAWGGDWVARLKAHWHNHQGVPTAEALAVEIDKLEKHIDWYGTIVAKQPDVWGHARLMRHRDQFDKVLAERSGKFEESLQGSISRSDQAFLASAFSLSAAISGRPAVELPQSSAGTQQTVTMQRTGPAAAAALASGTPAAAPPAATPTTIPIPNTNAAAGLTDNFATQGVLQRSAMTTGSAASTATPSQPPATPTTIPIPSTNAAAGLIDNFNTPGVLQRSDVKSTSSTLGFAQEDNSLEPTEYLNQLANYQNHLSEIRRVNEGDDTSDSPGYALHLIRIPVSILPGSKTRKGFGAEITVTATPYLGRDLLPVTFRNLVIKDLVDQLSTPITEYFNSGTSLKGFAAIRKARIAAVAALKEKPAQTQGASGPRRDGSVLGKAPVRALQQPSPSLVVRPPAVRVDAALRRTSVISELPAPLQSSDSINRKTYREAFLKSLTDTTSDAPPQLKEEAMKVMKEGTTYTAQEPALIFEGETGKLASANISTPVIRGRNARYAFPATYMDEVYSNALINPVVYQAFDVLLDRQINDADTPPVVQYQKVAGYIQDQVTAAYDFLARPESAPLWISFATPELARAVQSRDFVTLKSIRDSFLASLPNSGFEDKSPYGPDDKGVQFYTTTAGFSWAILVESVLLNEQLIRDIREAASSKGEFAVDQPQPYFLPCPPDEARDAFNAYVKTRFPVHVFALDPFVQEQNIANQLSRSRELQLALSLAFVTGNISASSMTRFARRLELQTSTIELNRTQFAFSHGDDTFGWRFQPRYQTPPIQNNLAAIAQTIGGGPTRDGDRRQLELEPGPRECVALVIMPSFVPYVTFETRSNWYRLTHPKCTEIDALKFLELSSSIKRAYTLAQAICDAGLYRDGDIGRLVNRVKQLSAELPMQSMITQVPYENTQGGFELFNVGVTALAPELRSWYGLPGVQLGVENKLFLVGDNFSVVSTDVVVGSRPSDPMNHKVTLLSKQVLSLTVPADVLPVMHGGIPCVEVSVATPYGVSQPLYIPVYTPPTAEPVKAEPPKAPTFSWTTPNLTVVYRFDDAGNLLPDNADHPTTRPLGGLSIGLDSNVSLDPTSADLTLFFGAPDARVRSIELTGVEYDRVSRSFEVTGANFLKLITDLVDQGHFGAVFSNSEATLPRDVTVSRTVLRLKGSGGPVVPQDVSNPLTIRWNKSTSKPAEPVTAPLAPATFAPAPAPPAPAPPAPGR